MRTRQQLLELINAAANALKSYEYGNSSPELAKEISDALLKVIEEESKPVEVND
ncbi:MAG: hypothetical protein KGL39_57760 [Patescibacteria group bacterium]|nr:hypothetical protein [Patescibacteria group bacterium]